MDKKLITLSLLSLILWGKAFLFAQSMMHYTSDEYGYSLQIPEDWQRKDEIRNESLSLVVYSKEGSTVSVTFFELKGLSKEQFIDRYEKSLQGQFNELSVQEKGVVKARDDEAPYLVYDYKKAEESIREKVCFYNREEEMALITANAPAEFFHKSLPSFDTIFKSFTFETNQSKVEGLENNQDTPD